MSNEDEELLEGNDTGESNEDVVEDNASEESNEQASSQSKEQLTNKAKQMAKETSKNAAKKNAKTFETLGKILSKLGPVLPWILLVIVIIIVVIGILAFFMSAPGLMTGKLKSFGQGVIDWLQGLYAGKSDALTNDQDVVDTANYIKSMGYDLIGYGFIPAKELTADEISKAGGNYIGEDGMLYDAAGNKVKNKSGYNIDRYGIQYEVTGDEKGAVGTFEVDGKISGFLDATDTSLIRNYIMSDRRLYIVRNYDKEGMMDKIYQAFNKDKIRWANGLISLYKATAGVATDRYEATDRGYIRVDSSKNTMTVKADWGSNPIEYSMNGWTGRYGLSLEFLLSLHLATMSPDLVTTMARSFDTEVQIYLDSLEDASITAYYRADDGKYLTLADLTKSYDGAIDNKDTLDIFRETGLRSQTTGEYACTGTEATKDTFNKEEHNVFKKDAGSKQIHEISSWEELQNGVDDGDILQDNEFKNFVKYISDAKEKLYTDDKANYQVTNADKEKIEELSTMTPENFASILEKYIPFENIKAMSENAGDSETSKQYDILIGTMTENGESVDFKFVIEAKKQNLGAGNDIGFVVRISRDFTQAEKGKMKNPDSPLCSDHIDDEGFTKACANCENFCEAVRNALKNMDASEEGDFKGYVPYIARVVGSWFRDTYFVIPYEDDKAIESRSDYAAGELSGEDVQVILVDEEYLEETKEHWTEYETDENGNYVLYKLNEDGTLSNEKWTGTEDDAAKEGIQVAKKPVTQTAVDLNNDEDETEEETEGMDKNPEKLVWSAYNYGAKNESGEKIEFEVTSLSNDYIKKVSNYDATTGNYDQRFYYSLSASRTIEQVEDGQRGVTNNKIKKMFKIRKYYIYDGTAERSEAIYQDWKKVTAGKDELEVEKAIDDLYYGTNTSTISYTEDPRNPDLIGNISINKDSLSAFAILENTHTLDADYAYRDFKELIVELNYFDKEDLSDKTEEVFEWIFPENGSANWPRRYFDKSEEFYGTLVHSKDMYDLLYNRMLEENGLEELKNTQSQKDDEALKNADSEYKAKLEEEKAEASEDETEKIGNTDGAVGSEKIILSSSFIDELKKNCEWIANYTQSQGFTYGYPYPSDITEYDSGSYTQLCCATGVAWALAKTSPELKEYINQKIAEGNNIAWAYNVDSYEGIGCIIEEKFGEGRAINSQSELQAGDVVFWKDAHVQLYLGDNLWFNSGGTNPVATYKEWDAIEYFKSDYGQAYAVNVTGNVGATSAGTVKKFEGYALGDTIVSPITGRIVEYGIKEKTITNEEVNGEKTTYKVDYIKLVPLLNEDAKNAGKLQASGLLNDKNKFEEEKYDIDDFTYLDAYKDFYDDYENVCDNYVLTIEGLNLIPPEEIMAALESAESVDEATISVTVENSPIEKVEKVEDGAGADAADAEEEETEGETESLEGEEKEFKINNYTPKQTPNLISDKKEEEFTSLEDAKLNAPCMFKIGEQLYIKAGTVIGYATDANIKMTLREGEKNAVVENIEDYFEIQKPEGNSSVQPSTQPYAAQDGDVELLAKLLQAEGCEQYFASKLGDDQLGAMASRVTGYVLLNRVLANYGNYGKTLADQISAPSQYSTADEVLGGSISPCDKCIANAEYCLTYDCSSITSPTTGKPMSKTIFGQAGFCQCDNPGVSCWWWVDTTGDGAVTEYPTEPYDTFYCE